MFSSEEEDFLLILGFTFLQNRILGKAGVIFNSLRLFNPNNIAAIKCLIYLSVLKNHNDEAYKYLQFLKKHDLSNRDRKWLIYIQVLLKNKISSKVLNEG